jgi:hypothetical protein
MTATWIGAIKLVHPERGEERLLCFRTRRTGSWDGEESSSETFALVSCRICWHRTFSAPTDNREDT